MHDDRQTGDDGFTLIEVMISMIIIVVGVISLAAAIATAARLLTGSQEQLIATQRAQEAIETVFKARDNRVLTWAQIRNIVGAGGDGGIFQDGPQDIRDPGADGLVNTADDGAVEAIIKPGADNMLGTGDDEVVPLYGFTREVRIRDIRANLREVRVIVRYRSSTGPTQFVLTTYLSSYA